MIMYNLTSISKIDEENSSFTEDFFIKQIPGWMPDVTKISFPSILIYKSDVIPNEI